MLTTQMIKSDAGEVVHLFKVMKKHKVACSLEMHTESSNPILGITQEPVSAVYLEGDDEGDSVIVHLGEAEIAFDLANHSFSKDVSDSQIFIAIGSDNYVFWFNSGAIPPEGIKESKKYRLKERSE